jgi:hypothetical protein
VLGDPTRTHREFEHKSKATPEEWVDRADLISKLVNPARTHRDVKHKFNATPEEWVAARGLNVGGRGSRTDTPRV